MNLAKIDTAKTFLIGPVLDADGVAVFLFRGVERRA